ncbi:MAG: ABC transporter substrate-binding protein [Candidatus Rokubacteria bacterium]|nr:ABC transporter substrate-binding protein [Candidatus Rokubacteria bacterium]
MGRWVLVAMASAVLIGASFFSVGAQPRVITIGYPAPVTGPGAQIGQFSVQGATLAVEQANAEAKDFRLVLKIEDGACEPKQAAAATEKLIRDGVHVLLGALCSSASVAATSISERAKTPIVVHTSSADKITEQGYRYVFRTTPNNTQVVNALFTQTMKEKPQRIGFVFEQTDWGRDAASKFRERAEATGIKVVAFDGVPRTEVNFVPLATKLKAASTDAVFVALLAPQAQLVLRNVSEVGFKPRWVGMQTIGTTDFLGKAGPLIDDLIAISFFEVTTENPMSARFREAFKKKYNREPETFAALAADGVGAIVDAVKRGGRDRESLRSALAQTANLPALAGPTTFDGKGQVTKAGFVVRWKNGTRELLR